MMSSPGCAKGASALDGSVIAQQRAMRHLWVTILSPKRFTPRTSLCCRGTHARMIISSAAWMGNLFLSDGKCAFSPLYFLFTVLAFFLGGLGRAGGDEI